jgi:Fe-S-cluster containining protein
MLTGEVPPPERRLKPGDTFRFSCSGALACFNTCCRNKDLILTPYDVLRLKTALNLHSDRFLEGHALYRPDPLSGFPVLSLRMRDDADKRCPFVGSDGCTVYPDRPTACRLYPLGRARGRASRAGMEEEFFFLLDTPACLGVHQERTVPLEDWLDGQGLDPYLEFNNRMLGVLFHKKRDPAKKLGEEEVKKVMVACYNLDVFRESLFRSGFLKQAGISLSWRRRLREDDEELLRFGFEFLGKVLFV